MMLQWVLSICLMSLLLIQCLAEPMKARLVNGTLGAGRLDLYFNGEWGTVCDNGFDKRGARVACRMLGFNSTEPGIVWTTKYGQGSGPILLQNIACNGAETSLDQCFHSEFYPKQCSHMEDVGVICNTEPMKVRLVNGTNEAGRLEVYFNGEWGTVCGYKFDKVDAQVACRMLGFIGTRVTAISTARYGGGSGQVVLGDMSCSGEETSLEQCVRFTFYPHDCSHSRDVGVICNHTAESVRARLVNGTAAAGRLEINYDGEWGTVCDNRFEKEEAQVACRMLGFNNTEAAVVGSGTYGQGSGPIVLSDLYCKGNETSLEQCSHSALYPRGCGHHEDVGVVCNITEPLKARLVNGTKSAGRLEIYFNGKWGTVCNTEFKERNARVACRMLGFNTTQAAVVGSHRYGQGSGRILLSSMYCRGDETSLEQCSHSVFYPHGWSYCTDVGVICNITEPMKVRLVNGTNVAGRLEVYFNGEWGTVCGHSFWKRGAQVACRMLGFNSFKQTAISTVRYGGGSGQVVLGTISCGGWETSLEQCSRLTFYPHDCSHSSDVGVICDHTEPMKVRLVNGTKAAGRLEVYFNGEWGTVCGHNFWKTEAQVACRMLGFNSTRAKAVGSARYGGGSGQVVLDDISCSGEETSLEQCSSLTFYPHDCSHSSDVGVICDHTEPVKARLVNGTITAGRLEIYFNGEWGTVCDDAFGKDDAQVVCGMLGFNNTEAAVVSSEIYGEGSGRVLLRSWDCEAKQNSLEQCSSFYPSGCSHGEDVGVICDIGEPLKARVVNGTKSSGRLEIYFNGQWGTVCSGGFKKRDARVACTMLGFNNTDAAAADSARYGQGSGPILLSRIHCKGDETSLDQCPHSVFYPHGRSYCTAEPMKVRLVNGTKAAGRLEVYFNGEWGTVCGHNFWKTGAQVACRMLGFNSTDSAVVSFDLYGQGSGYISLNKPVCRGDETSLEQCTNEAFYPNGCSHHKDVGVICNITEPLKARLVNGTKSAGRLEIYFNGQWGTVCNNGFERGIAMVHCRMLGFNNTKIALADSARYGQGSGPILLSNNFCRGFETSLDQCYQNVFYPHGCTHRKDVGVICNITDPMKARLVNGTMAAGRLEIYFNGEWGTVCNNNFGKEELQVACRMLGFKKTEAAAVGSDRYGQGSGPVLFGNVNCRGFETSLEQCSHRGFYPHGCTHSKDVGVICNITQPMKARLVNGTMAAGRLEIYFNGEWGTVCNNNFGKEELQVACRMLGFNKTEAAVVGSDRYGQGSGHVLLGHVSCRGFETSLEQCSHSGFYPHGCTHRRDVGVICNINRNFTEEDDIKGTGSSVDMKWAIFGGVIAGAVVLVIVVTVIVVCILRQEKDEDNDFQRTECFSDADPPDFTLATVQNNCQQDIS
ncbi:deleted in malignant brain tumors 1 protein-like isoform X3 [Pomacea canaliculata]|uniref:deleted in malignant brain tumors 1 protein-like isoform X3 n=1 Tax=Pomacea canaliculata TaxID=400727 RepID=UPI000D73BB18|nr:deleted in malignant brain tumors 1 protein-like isoform X3 [Pomacea canaliculata]